MASIAIASCYDKHNYGSVLQAYATQFAIAQLGFDVITLNKDGLTAQLRVNRSRYYRRNILDLSMYRAKKGFVLHRLRKKLDPRFKEKMDERKEAFDAFIGEHFSLAPEVPTFAALSEYCEQFSSVVVGSDQLWLPVNIAGDYYTLSFVPEGVNKVSYATSFGVSRLPEFYFQEMAHYLSGYHAISVREESGQKIVAEMGYDCEVVADPTLLLSRDDWDKLADGGLQVSKEPYVFCYFMGKNIWNRECAKRLAQASGCKIIAVSHLDEYVAYDDRGFADYQPYRVGPAQWLDLIKGAAYVCTDSFHGTVFASLYNKTLFVFRRHEQMGTQSTNSRLDTLLKRLGLGKRMCGTKDHFESIIEEPVDFSRVNRSIVQYRDSSAKWLASALR
ncbi:polysaccharide pyruvyl transferase family protein [Adlercreutzia murintestinalis]|jgi:Polysaccharide pyruvyl transferase.|uniref:polysaccharide pyruvyl transferase family protein n=1 Tax=Adlercreutzia murintestinalis TaxID=2941325 RepID=UPI002041C3CE|nr:polysaccharide pyruvyl transferase family protein [Adlercreutzia murintestinalis]